MACMIIYETNQYLNFLKINFSYLYTNCLNTQRLVAESKKEVALAIKKFRQFDIKNKIFLFKIIKIIYSFLLRVIVILFSSINSTFHSIQSPIFAFKNFITSFGTVVRADLELGRAIDNFEWNLNIISSNFFFIVYIFVYFSIYMFAYLYVIGR